MVAGFIEEGRGEPAVALGDVHAEALDGQVMQGKGLVALAEQGLAALAADGGGAWYAGEDEAVAVLFLEAGADAVAGAEIAVEVAGDDGGQVSGETGGQGELVAIPVLFDPFVEAGAAALVNDVFQRIGELDGAAVGEVVQGVGPHPGLLVEGEGGMVEGDGDDLFGGLLETCGGIDAGEVRGDDGLIAYLSFSIAIGEQGLQGVEAEVVLSLVDAAGGAAERLADGLGVDVIAIGHGDDGAVPDPYLEGDGIVGEEAAEKDVAGNGRYCGGGLFIEGLYGLAFFAGDGEELYFAAEGLLEGVVFGEQVEAGGAVGAPEIEYEELVAELGQADCACGLPSFSIVEDAGDVHVGHGVAGLKGLGMIRGLGICLEKKA